MAAPILEKFTEALFTTLHETFEQVYGIFLDKGTSLFETLETISAEEASRPVSDRCSTIAAQVNHIRYYLDVMEEYMEGRKPTDVDWPGSWQVGAVSPEEWAELQGRLRASYERVLGTLKGYTDWSGEENVGGAMAMVVHTAYHLGEIRQALCTIKR